jgi:hypothetical protein
MGLGSAQRSDGLGISIHALGLVKTEAAGLVNKLDTLLQAGHHSAYKYV